MSRVVSPKHVACLTAAWILQFFRKKLRNRKESDVSDLFVDELEDPAGLVCELKTLSGYVDQFHRNTRTLSEPANSGRSIKYELLSSVQASENLDGMKTMARMVDSVNAAVDRLCILKNKNIGVAEKEELERIIAMLQPPSERLQKKFLETAATLGIMATDSTIDFLLYFSTPPHLRHFTDFSYNGELNRRRTPGLTKSKTNLISPPLTPLKSNSVPTSSLRKSFSMEPKNIKYPLGEEVLRHSESDPTTTKRLYLSTSKAKRLKDLKMPQSPELLAELQLIDSWTEFDIFKVGDLTNNRPLVPVAMCILEKFDLFNLLGIERDRMLCFLDAIENEYNCNVPANPYHNSLHAADVVQAMSVFLGAWGLQSQLTDLEIFACLISSIVHDVGHPGVSNDFQVKRRHQRAIIYNDTAVNENHHACRAFQLALEEENNFLACLTPEDCKELRRMVIQMVVGTDMSQHFTCLAQFTAYLSESTNISEWQDPMAALKLVMHASDISNPGKPEKWAVAWAQLIVDEFSLQGDLEKQLGMPVSPLCDRYKNTMPRSQLGFVNLIVEPTFTALADLLPAIKDEFMPCLEKTRKCWATKVAELEASEAAQSSTENN